MAGLSRDKGTAIPAPENEPAAPNKSSPAEASEPSTPSRSRRIGFDHGLEGWSIDIRGGTPEHRGSVTVGSAWLREGDSYYVSLDQSFTVPENPAPVVFRYTELDFDTSDPDSMNDTFEAAVVTRDGQSLVPPFASGRDSFFNIAEESPTALGSGATETGSAIKTVTLDMTGVAAGTEALIRFWLVNNDQDTKSEVRILDVSVPSSDNTAPVLNPVADVTGTEGSPVVLAAAFVDPDAGDSYTAVVAWGDGSTSVATVTSTAADKFAVSASHIYADNKAYTATVTITDAAGASDEKGFIATISNVSPGVVVGASFRVASPTQLRVVLDGDLTDPGFTRPSAATAETFTATVDWGDGLSEPVTLDVTPGSEGIPTRGRFSTGHQYAQPGVYAARVTVRDDDGGEGIATTSLGVARLTVTRSLDFKAGGSVPVLVPRDPGFDATKIDAATVRFAPAGVRPANNAMQVRPADVRFNFAVAATGAHAGDTSAVLTGRLTDGTFFAAVGPVTVSGVSPPPPPSASGPTQFFVADAAADTSFRYAPDGSPSGSFKLDGIARDPRGAASNAAGDKVWVIDGVTHAVTVQAPDGTLLGHWRSVGLQSPQGLGVDGADVWVADAATRKLVRYAGAAGQLSGAAVPTQAFALDADNVSPSGVDAAGGLVWVTDDGRDAVFVYDRTGVRVGRWALDAANADPSGLTGDPTGASADLWVADRADDRVYRYADGRAFRDGSQAAADSFALAAGNTQPEGLADPPALGPVLSVVAPASGSSFPVGTQVLVNGRMVVDPEASIVSVSVNDGPADTVDAAGNWFESIRVPVGTTNLVVTGTEFLPRVKVTFDDAEFAGSIGGFQGDLYRNRGVVFSSSTAPQLTFVEDFYKGHLAASQPYAAVAGPAGTPGTFDINAIRADFVVPGTATPATVSSVSVFVGDRSGENDNVVLRAYAADGRVIAQEFFSTGDQPGIDPTRPGLSAPSSKVLSVAGEDIAYVILSADQTVSFDDFTFGPVRATATATLTLTGTPPAAGGIDFAQFSDVSASFRGEYGRTSLKGSDDLLFAELAVRNAGDYPADAPLFVGVTNISDPTVRVHDPAGTTPDGTPYFDFSSLVAGGLLRPGERTASGTLAFFNPESVQFTYDLVFLGRLNRAPEITTVPDVEALAARIYRYDVDATDRDDDAITYSLTAGPPGMTIDPDTGRITWPTAPSDVGTQSVAVRASDGRGGVAEQRYTLAVIVPPPNRPPVFTSVPVVEAQVSQVFPSGGAAAPSDYDNAEPTRDYGQTFIAEDSLVAGVQLYINDPTRPGNPEVNELIGPADLILYDATDLLNPVELTRSRIVPPGASVTGLMSFLFDAPVQTVVGRKYFIAISADDLYGVGMRDLLASVYDGGAEAFRDRTTGQIAEYFSGRDLSFAVLSGEPYRYTATARDPDDDTLRFSVASGPTGLTIDGATGAVRWTPTAAQVGEHALTLRVDDGFGGIATQAFVILVDEATGNRAPVIVTDPVTLAAPGRPYRYDVDATDPDGDPLTYSLATAPAGMTIDAATGQIAWTPDPTAAPPTVPMRLGSDGNDDGFGTAIDADGNTYLSGVFSGTADFDPGPGSVSLTSAGGSDMYVAKYDRSGNLRWARSAGSVGSDVAYAVSVDPHGNVYATGYFQNTVDFDPGPGVQPRTASGPSDAVVWKLDSDGAFVWVRTVSGPGADVIEFSPVKFDAAGSVYVAGSFTGTIDFDLGAGSYPLTSAGSVDTFVWKLDGGGNFIWARRVGGTADDAPTEVTLDVQGNVLVAGYFNLQTDQPVDFDPGLGEFNLTGRGYIWKLDGAGHFLWARSIAVGGSGQPSTDAEGNVYVQGTFTGTGDFDPGPGTFMLTSAGERDNYVWKLDSAGNFVWARRFGGSGDDGSGGQGTVVDSHGNLYVGMTFQQTATFSPGQGSFSVTSNGSYDAVLVKLSSAGDVIWHRPFGGSGHDTTYHLALDDHGNLHSTGRFWGTVDFDPGPAVYNLTSAGASDAYHIAFTPDGSFLRRRGAVTVRVEDGRGGADTQSFTIDVVAPNGVDLAVPDVDPDALVFDGQQLTVSGTIAATVANLGTQPVAGPFDVLFFEDRNNNSRYDAGVDTKLGTQTVTTPLAAGAVTTVTAALRGSVLFSGNRIWAMADSGQAVAETDEANNLGVHFCHYVSQSGQIVPAPDLTASYVRASQSGQTVTYTARIGNGGSVFAPAGVYVSFYAGDPRTGGQLRGSVQTTLRLEPGQYEDVSFSVPGPFVGDVWVVADDTFSRTGGYAFSSFDVPGATSSVAYCVDSAGLIVGSGNGKGYVLDAGVFNIFALPSAARTEPLSVNDRGQIAGVWVDGGENYFGFLSTTTAPRTTTPINVPGANGRTVPYGINDAGEIVGHTTDPGNGPRHGFWRSTAGVYTSFDYPGAPSTWAFGNNDRGELVGGWGSGNFQSHGWFRGASGVFTTINVPNATVTTPQDINDAGQIVGTFRDASGRYHGFLRDAAGVVALLDVPSSVQTGIRGISDAGQIAGQWQDSAGEWHSFVAAPVGQIRECDEDNNFYRWQQTDAPVNHTPAFTSTPPASATFGQLLRYRATAADPDGDSLAFDLVVRPVGMAVDPASGVVVWVPTADQLGDHDVTLRVRDGRGGVALQSFRVAVARPNSAPVITSAPTGPAVVGVPYHYQLHAQDADGDAVTFALVESPVGAAIDPVSGLVSWTPTAGQVGTHHFAITASDGRGGVATQLFDLPVVATAPNRAPTIASTPRFSVRIGDPYRYQVVAADPDGDPLTYSLEVAPAGMAIDAAGLVGWVPTAAQFGPNPVRVRVEDGRGGFAVQAFAVTVVSQATNRAPTITSAPPAAATIARLYAFDLAATDPDGDPLTWSLDEAPAGTSIDPVRGTLRWTPSADQLGDRAFVVRVADGLGGWATQAFTVRVRAVNVPPNVVSTPPTTAVAGRAYAYPVAADDADGDILTFRLTAAPSGMTINSSTGLVTWTPGATQLGAHAVTVVADDGLGGVGTQTYTVVVALTENRYPVITSTPPLSAAVGQPYSYAVTATDPDRDALLFALLAAPTGMSINPNSGLVTWTPSPFQVGLQSVTVAAIDPHGAGGTQTYTIAVTVANHHPTITSSPIQVVTAGLLYGYDVIATDPDGDALAFTLDQGPAGMTVDALGRLRWSPGIPQVGVHRIAVSAEDPHGAFVTQTFDLAVVADTLAPRIDLLLSDNPASVGTPVLAVVVATDNVGVASLDLTVNGVPVPLDHAGRATLTFPTAGIVPIVATARDAAGNVSTASTNLPVIDPSDQNAPDVDITAPTDGATLSAPVVVTGTATDANLLYYTLSVAPLGSDVFTEFARGTSPVVNGVLGRLDTAALANDAYTLRLLAVDAGGNQSVVTQRFDVRGDLKLGNFTLSFTDLTVPVSGLPVSLTRTYDTLTAATADEFGYGWRLEFRDTDLRTSVLPTGYEEYGTYNPFRDGSRVYVALPGGRREGFTFHPERLGGFGGLFAFYRPAFVADPGVTTRLSVPDNDTLIAAGGGYFTLADVAYNPADTLNFAGQYTLTTKDGLAYSVDAVSGDLLTLTDANGNALTYADDGITSNRGTRIAFDRDPQGRIIAAIDPAGNRVRYRYDLGGDLVGVTDRDGNETRFVYAQPTRPHYLTEVIDPLGRSGVRTEYDAQGRLVRLIDANGKTVELAHDPSHSVETVRDPLGNPTTFEYDDRGNVVRQLDALGNATLRTYDASNNLLSERDPLGHAWFYSYDGDGNVLTTTDPNGTVTRNTYLTTRPGAFESIRGARSVSLLASTTDALGNTTTNEYAGVNLVATIDAAGTVTRYAYDANGNQTSVTDALGGVSRFEYDGRGNLTRQVDAGGHATDYVYDANGNQITTSTTITTAAGPRTQFTHTAYDASGRVTAVTDAEGGVARTEYDALGRQAATIDALGRRTEFRYDERGQLTEVIFPDATPASLLDNPRTRTEYDDAGRAVARIDEAGRRTEFRFDPLGRQTETIFPDATPGTLADNPRTRTEYDAAGRVTAQIDERGNRTVFFYDDAGHQITVRDALGDETHTAYDGAGRTASVTDALGHVTGFTLDTLGRQTATTFADGTAKATAYDKLGRVTGETDQLGRTTHFDYDTLGRLAAVVDALGQRTEYGYDEAGNLVTQRDANGHVTRYEYDGLGRRTATQLPLGQRSATRYDAVGNVAGTTDFNGASIAFDYDPRNRLTAKHLPGGATVAFTYTLTGQRASETDARGATLFAYDERGRLLSRTDPDGKQISYAYDAAGDRTSVTTPAGTTVYTFDALNRTATVTDPTGGVTRYAYDKVGNQTRADLPNGTFEVRSYDTLNRLVMLENRGPSGVISSYAYTLAATGRRDAVTEQDGRRVAYSYDALDRLTGEAITAAAGNRTIAYTYDPVGNRLSRSDTAEATTLYAYDANDRLLTETSGAAITVYAYDANGNTLSKTAGPQDRAAYTWDAENRLVRADVTDATGTRRLDYRYNADGIRVSSSVDGEETRYLIDAVQPYAQVLLEYRPSGLVVASYVYGNDLVSQLRGGVASYYHVDGLGSTRALTNAAGQVTDRYTYEAFGRTIARTGATVNAYQFAGEQRDAGLGLDYLRARYLSVGTGRFYGHDPFEGSLRSPVTLHKFFYAGNDPANRTDPTGQFIFFIASAVSDLLVQYTRSLFYDYTSRKIDPRFNPIERQLYRENPGVGEKVKVAITQSFIETYFEYSTDEEVVHNGNGDAFRHAYWNALMVHSVGPRWAERWATAHEDGDPNNPPLERAMDLFNNNVGRGIGSVSSGNLVEEVKDKVGQGVMRRIVNGQLAPTNWDGSD